MRELSLFTGAGGGLLGTKLLGWKHIGYVEWDDYCQRVIAQRIKDGIIDDAPIFGNIRAFIDSGCAELYRGITDVITAGFPCQPFSVAGTQAGEDDARNMWPATIECIRIIRPQHVMLENVPGLITNGYIRRVFGDLAESGFNAQWRVLSAAELGAPHKRDRLWIVANAASQGQQDIERSRQVRSCARNTSIGTCCDGAGDSKWRNRNPWHETEPGMDRVVDGLAYGMDRLKAIGNGQVPIVVRTAWELLT